LKQSSAQLDRFSKPSVQMPSPHTVQSSGQVDRLSLNAQKPSPRLEQSVKQLRTVSAPLQIPSPHELQSLGQLATLSRPWHLPSPQRTQSEGQASPTSQLLLQTPRQSAGQVKRVSAISQRPLPHKSETKQS